MEAAHAEATSRSEAQTHKLTEATAAVAAEADARSAIASEVRLWPLSRTHTRLASLLLRLSSSPLTLSPLTPLTPRASPLSSPLTL